VETNGINLYDQAPDQKKNSKTTFALSGLVALGVVGALGVGFVMGGRGSGRHSDVAGTSATATRTLPISPTAATQPRVSPIAGAPQGQPGSAVAGNATGNSGGGSGSDQPASNAGDVNDDGVVSVPTNTPVPPAPTNTPVTPAPTDTPVAPTSTPMPPTATATATAIVPLPTFTICIPCITPPVLIVDFTPPTFLSTYRADCLAGTALSFTVDETSEMWATYEVFALPSETAHQSGTAFDALVGGFLFHATSVEFHAVDSWGNEATFSPSLSPCL
jgi:hypothetical protein